MQLVMVESAWFALLAAALGALFAWGSAPFVVGMINPPDNPARLVLPADWRVAKVTPADVGRRPNLDDLGPIHWQPSPAPDWSLPDEHGKRVSLRDYRGRPVIVIFFLGTGCPHCIEQLNAFGPTVPDFAAAGITLVAVSKTHDAAAISTAIAAGQRVFGENRVQEAQGKYPALKAAHPDLVLHLIGPLQTNKVKESVALFDVIETVDRPKLADALAREMERTGRRCRCFIQVNTGEEPQKAGVLPAAADAFIAECRERWRLPVVGLMCIPPLDQEPRDRPQPATTRAARPRVPRAADRDISERHPPASGPDRALPIQLVDLKERV